MSPFFLLFLLFNSYLSDWVETAQQNGLSWSRRRPRVGTCPWCRRVSQLRQQGARRSRFESALYNFVQEKWGCSPACHGSMVTFLSFRNKWNEVDRREMTGNEWEGREKEVPRGFCTGNVVFQAGVLTPSPPGHPSFYLIIFNWMYNLFFSRCILGVISTANSLLTRWIWNNPATPICLWLR